MTIQPEGEDKSCLCSEVADNSAIYGILSGLSTLGTTLISVTVTDQEGQHEIELQ
jgi:cobalamin biosynthesis protein CbiD